MSGISSQVDELRARDKNEAFAAHLFNNDNSAKLASLFEEFGEELVLQVINEFLWRTLIDGCEVGSVKTWDYFRPALGDQNVKGQMAAEGLRPGDTFGAYRKWTKGGASHA